VFCWSRPNAPIFRLTLALALLAWTALASGAPLMTDASPMQVSQSHAQGTNDAAHCHDAMMASAGMHAPSMPVAPAQRGDCCQAACHCLATSTAVMTVPWVFVAFIPSGGHGSAGPQAPVPPVLATPPLRPPIA
jgi:hypothetical protein